MDMNHLIGQRFNLISKSDIRYVGTLHEINPEASTIALENVMSYGTEGRRGNPADEVAPSSSVYEYIVFRGSDVKDISVAGEEKPEPAKPEQPQVPNDPAILGSMPRPGPGPGPEPGSAPQAIPQSQPPPQQAQGARQPPQGFPQQPQFPPGYYPPYGQRFGPPPPFPPGPGFPNMPYGAPPGWYPPPGHPFPQGPGQFPPQMPIGPPGAAPPPKPTSELPVGDKPSSRNATPAAQNAPTPPVESKPTVAEAMQSSVPPSVAAAAQRGGRAVPAIPIAAPAKPAAPVAGPPATDATAAATAAVAAAMAKLPQPGAQKADVETVTRKMNEMRPYDNNRAPRGGRGGRGAARTQQQQHKKMELPQSDYDFETANAKFNKQDLVKEAIATGSPAAEAEAHAPPTSEDQVDDTNGTHGAYNRTTSFFDNISSEARDREENVSTRFGGREWRAEEEKRNMDTFGQGSVDGYRGRGRGRGRGYGRGRGGYGRGYGQGYGRGRGGMRGGRAPSAQSTGVPSQN
ncbi:hypothetical protein N7474_000964 [Penicillium riverlandense]|uniref:uncharacterized protein n=1 Tax=Penicillium riverlandense TaxID=1903569 RepID=UPI0025489FB4|nr:uncharacterized protein N7474_000964 [Penicillium riverlandense]KAJ5832653.1 hypothetical protein N7474_000964 [Penicillium riverlandense]